jgi:hypothetical protein
LSKIFLNHLIHDQNSLPMTGIAHGYTQPIFLLSLLSLKGRNIQATKNFILLSTKTLFKMFLCGSYACVFLKILNKVDKIFSLIWLQMELFSTYEISISILLYHFINYQNSLPLTSIAHGYNRAIFFAVIVEPEMTKHTRDQKTLSPYLQKHLLKCSHVSYGLVLLN